MTEKSKILASKQMSGRETTLTAGHSFVTAAGQAIETNEQFFLKERQSFQHENKKLRKIPDTTQIDEVVLNKVKITEASEIIFKDSADNTYRAHGQISYEDEKPETKRTRALPESQERSAYVQDTQKVESESLVYFRQTIRNQNKYFFKVRNHTEFFQVGKSYLEDLKQGQRFFLFSHIGARREQQQSLIGIASYFQYYEKMKILILSSSLTEDFFGDLLAGATLEHLRVSAKHTNLAAFYFQDDLTFLDVRSLYQQRFSDTLSQEQVLAHFLRLFDCVLFDMPEIPETKCNLEFYFPVLKFADSVSLTLAKNSSKFTRLKELMDHYHAYKVKIKGTLISDRGNRSDKKQPEN